MTSLYANDTLPPPKFVDSIELFIYLSTVRLILTNTPETLLMDISRGKLGVNHQMRLRVVKVFNF